ncbi:MAG: hypothetical protein AB1730_23390 [Myxococcota bacterium]|jgi:hypothetical protein
MELSSTLASAAFLRRLQDLTDSRLGAAVKTHRPPPLGPAIVAAKKTFRRAFQPFINEVLGRQTLFNEELVIWGRAITRDVEALERSMTALRTSIDLRLSRLEAAVARLEARDSGSAPGERSDGPRPKPHVGA